MPLLPRIANFDDLDPLRAEPGVDLVMVPPGNPLPRDAALVILPGSKATLADLGHFCGARGGTSTSSRIAATAGISSGCAAAIRCSAGASPIPRGAKVRPARRRGSACSTSKRSSAREKQLRETTGIDLATGMQVRGYEMHLGMTSGPGLARPMLDLGGRPDGAVSPDGRVAGCYLHGLFASDAFRRAFLARLGADASAGIAYDALIDRILDRLADHLERHLDLAALLAAARAPRLTRAA